MWFDYLEQDETNSTTDCKDRDTVVIYENQGFSSGEYLKFCKNNSVSTGWYTGSQESVLKQDILKQCVSASSKRHAGVFLR